MDAPWNVIPLHIRAGSILALHGRSPNGTPFLTTADARRAPFRLVVAMDEDQSAEGRLYLDDGVSLDVEGATSNILFAASQGSLQMFGSFDFPTTVRIEHITLLGVDEDTAFVTVNGQEVEVEPSSAGGVVEIDVSLPMDESFTLTWSPRSSSGSDSSGGLSNGAVAGIVVGSVVGVAGVCVRCPGMAKQQKTKTKTP